MKIVRSLAWFLIVCCSVHAQSVPSGQSSNGPAMDLQPDLALQSSVYVKVQLANTVRVPALKTGDVVEGKLVQGVYSGSHELFPAGSPVHLTVDKLGRRRRVPNDHWPWVIKAFTPRHENYPTFQTAAVTLPDGTQVPLRVSLISLNHETEIHATRKKTGKNAPESAINAMVQNAVAHDGETALAHTELNNVGSARVTKKRSSAVITLEAMNPACTASAASSKESFSASAMPDPVTLAAGTLAKIILLGGVSASKSRPGDSVQARLVEPVWLGLKVVLPEGTLLGGKVVKRTPPRVLSRAGSIMITFTDITLPGRPGIPAAASVTAVDLDQRSHTRIDPEGKLHGDRPGKAWMAINIGVTAGIAKEADDTIQLIIEAVVSSATDASTAGVGRIVATCASGLFLLTRHGRDVVLPRFTEMNIVFDRSLSLPGSQPASSAP